MEEETGRETEPITVELISKDQFCKIMNAIRAQDDLMDSVCDALARIADIFAFDVNNRYRQELENLLIYLFDDKGDWIAHWMYDGNWKQIKYWDEQDEEHTISSLEDLYDFLIENLLAHRRADTASKEQREEETHDY